MEILKGQEAVSALIGVLPYIIEALPPDMLLCVTDGKNYLQVAEGEELKIGITVGSQVLGSATEKCINENRRTIFNVREAHGTPFKGVNVPIVDEDGYPVGTLLCGIGRKKQQDLSNVAEQLSISLDQLAIATSEISRSAGQITIVGQRLTENTQQSSSKIKETELIINTIKHISNQTNLLGLNAAIESARAGEHGRGFNVVAQEIRKLADNSKLAAEQINKIIAAILSSVGDMIQAVEESGAISQQQAAATEENAATIEQLRNLAYIVKDTAAKL